jgi:DNA-directed RNA polymerase subunit beta'
MTMAIGDIHIPAEKKAVLALADAEVELTDKQFRRGLITEGSSTPRTSRHGATRW